MKVKLEATTLVNSYEETILETKKLVSKFLNCGLDEVESRAEIEIRVLDDQMMSDGNRIEGFPYTAKIFARIK